jgi:signal transduction histidine kinase
MNKSCKAELLSAISNASSFDDLGRAIVEASVEAFNAEVSTIWRRHVDDNGVPRLSLLAASAKAPRTLAQEVTYVLHEDDATGRKADGVTGYVAQTRQEVHVSSFTELQKRYGFCWQGKIDKNQWEDKPKKHFRSLLAVPLCLGDRLVGVWKLENKRGSDSGFPGVDRQTMRQMVPEIALAVHSFGLLQEREKLLIQVPAKLVAALLGPFDPKQLTNEIVKTVADSVQAEICSLWRVDAGGKELRLADSVGFSTEARSQQTYRLAPATADPKKIDGITAWVAIHKKPFWANSWEELQKHPSWKGKWDKQMWHDPGKGFRCLYAVPLLRQDSVIGVLKVENRKGAAFFTDSDRALCGILANLIVLLDLGQEVRTASISDLMHLIRSPIGQVSMNVEGLEREIQRSQSGKRLRPGLATGYLDLIKKALLNINITSRTLAVYVRKTQRLAPSETLERVSLKQLVEQRCKEIEPLLFNNIIIRRRYPGRSDDPTVALDPIDRTSVGIVIDNILYNAVKYSHINAVVDVCLQSTCNHALLTIHDQGCGISKEGLPRIWEAGFSRRAQGHPQGTGMGLSSVQRILDRLGWKPTVESHLNKGTKFQIAIPLK